MLFRSFHQVTDAPERSLSVVSKINVTLASVYKANDEPLCAVLDRCREVSLDLLERVPQWLDDIR